MTTTPIDDWLRRSNASTLDHLIGQAQTGPGLTPFLGAGTSMEYGFKNWRNVLLDAAPPWIAARVKGKLDKGMYEEAAELLLKQLGPDGFQNMVAASAGDAKLGGYDFSSGIVSLLPLLASGPVVTTNFDRVLERAFEANATPFDSVISGPRPDLIVNALHGNRRVLIKLHGDWQDRVGRTFTKSDYDTNYGASQPENKRVLLESAELLLFSSRSMLFIGASLVKDRTVSVLQDVHQKYAGIRHFAILEAPKSLKKLNERERGLAECGVLPLWYQLGTTSDHAARVRDLVVRIVEGMSVRKIESKKKASLPLVQAGSKRKASSELLTGHRAHFDRVVPLIQDGRLNFFLGAAIHQPTDQPLLARSFYKELARIFECEALKQDAFAVTQYIADLHRRETLYRQIRNVLDQMQPVSKATHEFFADWGRFKIDGQPLPYPAIFTTNYDDILERCLDQAALPYHLLSYQCDGPHRGAFFHRTPRSTGRAEEEQTLWIIDRPQNIRSFSPGFLIVKLNGGQDPQRSIPESYCSTRLDYWDLAARIPGVLPAAVQKIVGQNPILFLGHGLAAPDVESFVRFAHKNHPGPRSWAVALKKDGVRYWRQCGVEIVNKDVNAYMHTLHRKLLAQTPLPLGRGAPRPKPSAHR